MKRNRINRLIIGYFKGIISLDIKLGMDLTTISGRNGLYKTSIIDAYNWLLFNKTSKGDADFGIKTLKDGKPMSHLVHFVEGHFYIDGEEVVLRKEYTETWKKLNGSIQPELTGHSNRYFIDGVPQETAKAFNAIVDSMAPKEVFQILSNVLFFNSDKSFAWEKRRAMIMEMGGKPTDDDIKGRLTQSHIEPELIEFLLKGQKNIDDKKRTIKHAIKELEKSSSDIPTRIQEAQNNKPEPADEKLINEQVKIRETQISQINLKMQDASIAAQEQVEKRTEIATKLSDKKIELSAFIRNFQADSNTDIAPLQRQHDDKLRQISDAEGEVIQQQSRIDVGNKTITETRLDTERDLAVLEQKKDVLRSEYDALRLKTFSLKSVDDKCPTCGQEVPDLESKIADIEKKFNTTKANDLQKNVEDGKALVVRIEEVKALSDEKIAKFQSGIDDINIKIEELNRNIESYKLESSELREKLEAAKNQTSDKKPEDDPQYILLVKERNELQEQLDNFVIERTDTIDLQAKVRTLNAEITELKVKLKNNDDIERMDKRVEELTIEFKSIGGKVAELKGELEAVKNFEYAQIEAMEENINKMFSITKFKMFTPVLNGETDFQAVCIATDLEGREWKDMNTALQINVGIDCVNALSSHLGLSVPLFIDNTESVNELIDCKSQLIATRVTSDDYTLRIETNS